MSSRIELSDVGQVFSDHGDTDEQERDVVALSRVNLTIDAGELITVVGPSGCGKSAVLDLIGGRTRPTSGVVSIDGEEIRGPGRDRSRVCRQHTLLPWRTAQANIEFALESVGGWSKRERTHRARECLELVGLVEFADHYPHELSGGMRQRIAIARSLSYEPSVLLMDEPFDAWDAQTRERLQHELIEIWRRTGTTIVFVTPDIEEAVFLGTRVAVMSGGPGTIRAVVNIHLDHRGGRDDEVRGTQQFATYRHHIWSLLREEQPEPWATHTEEVQEIASLAG